MLNQQSRYFSPKTWNGDFYKSWRHCIAIRKSNLYLCQSVSVSKLSLTTSQTCCSVKGLKLSFANSTLHSSYTALLYGACLDFRLSTMFNRSLTLLAKREMLSIRVNGKWAYLAAVMDLGRRKIVGWALGTSPNANLACKALKQALLKEQPVFRADSSHRQGAASTQVRHIGYC